MPEKGVISEPCIKLNLKLIGHISKHSKYLKQCAKQNYRESLTNQFLASFMLKEVT